LHQLYGYADDSSSPAPISHLLYGYAEDTPDIFLYSMAETAKILGIGRNILTAGLRYTGILETGMEHNKPVELYVSQGYFQYSMNNNRGKITYTTKVTHLGVELLAGIIAGHPKIFTVKKRKPF